MTIYVDDPVFPFRGSLYCHMMTDQLDLTELHEMAVRLGVRRYFQSHRLHPHYDLAPSKRKRAIELGATAVTSKEMVERCSLLFTDTLT